MSEQPNTMIESTTESLSQLATETEYSEAIQHVTVEHDDDIAVCTMFPQDVEEEEEISSQWITATGGAFDSLEAWQ